MTIACVTGAAGFIGSHIVRELLARGYAVRAVLRDAGDSSKTAHLQRLAEGLPGALELHGADLTTPRSLDAIVDGCQQVYHAASAVLLRAKDPQREIVDPALRATESVLGSVERAASVEALAVTSSAAAIADVAPRPDHTYTEDDWNRDASLQHSPYPLSKTLAERLVWRWHEALSASRELPLTVINPTVVFGPVYAKVHLRSSPSIVTAHLVHYTPACPRVSLPIVDVRDVAAAHIAGVEQRVTGRFILYSEALWMREIAQILAPAFPDYDVRTLPLPGPLLYLAALLGGRFSLSWVRNNLGMRSQIDASKVTRELGIALRPARESVLDTARSAVENGLVPLTRVRRRPVDPVLRVLERLWA